MSDFLGTNLFLAFWAVWELLFNIPQCKKLFDSHLDSKIKFYTQVCSKNAPFALNSDGWVFFQTQIYFYHFERFENFFSTYLSAKNCSVHIWTVKLNFILSFIPKMPLLLSIRTDECFFRHKSIFIILSCLRTSIQHKSVQKIVRFRFGQ